MLIWYLKDWKVARSTRYIAASIEPIHRDKNTPKRFERIAVYKGMINKFKKFKARLITRIAEAKIRYEKKKSV